jgi:hypothetical protein
MVVGPGAGDGDGDFIIVLAIEDPLVQGGEALDDIDGMFGAFAGMLGVQKRHFST